jgi:hypothetical protein
VLEVIGHRVTERRGTDEERRRSRATSFAKI